MQTATPDMTQAKTPEQPTISLPTARLLTVVVGVPALVGAGWWLIGMAKGWSQSGQIVGVIGAGLVAVISTLSLLVMTPWTTRRISGWMTLWQAATVLRLLGTPIAAYVLYSATSLDGGSLALSIAVAYVLTLFCEAAVLSLYLKRAC